MGISPASIPSQSYTVKMSDRHMHSAVKKSEQNVVPIHYFRLYSRNIAYGRHDF